MKSIKKVVDESEKVVYPPGPWDDEPDYLEIPNPYFEACIARMRFFGHLCGYIALPKGHVWYGRSLDLLCRVHGGITFGEERDDSKWVIGFDCNHGVDCAPINIRMPYGNNNVNNYRTIKYVKAEIRLLIMQAMTPTLRGRPVF
jgi:hypothetical protein